MKFRTLLQTCLLTLLLAAVPAASLPARAEGGEPEALTAVYPMPNSLPLLTGNVRMDQLAIAKSQIGEHAYKAGKIDNKHVSYFGDWAYTGIEGKVVNKKENWCSEFASWCLYKAGMPVQLVPVCGTVKQWRRAAAALGNYYLLEDNTNYVEEAALMAAIVDDEVQMIPASRLRAGDVLQIDHSDPYTTATHTAVFLALDETGVQTIDGNMGNGCKICHYEFHEVMGVCRMPYPSDLKISAKKESGGKVKVSWSGIRSKNIRYRVSLYYGTQLLAQKTFSGTSHSGTFSKIGSGKRGSRRRIRVVVQAMGKKVSSATTSKTIYVTPVKWEPLTAFMKVTTLRI